MNVNEEYRKIYETLKGESEKEVDTYIRYLAGGALVLSLTFIKGIIPKGAAVECECIIIYGWIFLISSLLSNFISYYFTIYNLNKTIKDIDDDVEDWGDEAVARNKPIIWINYLSSALCILGIIFITIFVSLNI